MAYEKDGHDAVMLICDEERIDAVEAENAQLRREVDALWSFLFQLFEGRFGPSTN